MCVAVAPPGKCSELGRRKPMLTKRTPVSHAFPARFLQLGALLLLSLGSVAQGQHLTPPCSSIFSYRLDQNTNQVFGYLKLPGLRIGHVFKLEVELSIGAAVAENNVGSITLVKSREQTLRDIYNNQPAQYRVNFPLSNVIPNLMEIRVNGKPICYGQKAKGQLVTTINLDHTLVTQLQTLSKPSVSIQSSIQLQAAPQTPQIQPQPQLQQQIVQTRLPAVRPTPQPSQPSPRPAAKLQQDQNPRPQSQSNDVCGRPASVQNRLSVNGKIAPRGQFPWAVPVFDTRRATKPKYICGSTIISKYHLVTAGHCMHDDFKQRLASDLLTVPGMYNIDNFLEPGIQMHDVASVFVHPHFYSDDYGTTEYDIALMVLQKAIMYSDLVRPICLWNENVDADGMAGKTGYVSGWGITENGDAKKPSYVMAKVLPNNQCRRNLGNIFASEKGMFCANGVGGVPCTGDSGSGFILKQGSQFYIRGIVSIGQFDPIELICDTKKYVVYTGIAPFRLWLQNKMNTVYSPARSA